MEHHKLYVDSLEFGYKNKQAIIKGAYLACLTGDIIALFGRNGCGKSTLMQLIFGSLKANHSYLLLDGKKYEKAYITNKIGYLPQDSFLPTNLKVLKLIKRLVPSYARTELLIDVRIKTLIDRKIYQLSGGELRYLELCILITQPTYFLLLDEPFTGIEPNYIVIISDLILKFKSKKGFTITDHNYRYLLDIATKLLLLENGTCRQLKHSAELNFHYLPDKTFDDYSLKRTDINT